MSAHVTSGPLERLKTASLDELPAAAALLETRAPAEDAAAFKVWLKEVAQKEGKAGTEGGFLGFGVSLLSDAEKATLAEIARAFGSGVPDSG
jgi:hypothetical protein